MKRRILALVILLYSASSLAYNRQPREVALQETFNIFEDRHINTASDLDDITSEAQLTEAILVTLDSNGKKNDLCSIDLSNYSRNIVPEFLRNIPLSEIRIKTKLESCSEDYISSAYEIAYNSVSSKDIKLTAFQLPAGLVICGVGAAFGAVSAGIYHASPTYLPMQSDFGAKAPGILAGVGAFAVATDSGLTLKAALKPTAIAATCAVFSELATYHGIKFIKYKLKEVSY